MYRDLHICFRAEKNKNQYKNIVSPHSEFFFHAFSDENSFIWCIIYMNEWTITSFHLCDLLLYALHHLIWRTESVLVKLSFVVVLFLSTKFRRENWKLVRNVIGEYIYISHAEQSRAIDTMHIVDAINRWDLLNSLSICMPCAVVLSRNVC